MSSLSFPLRRHPTLHQSFLLTSTSTLTLISKEQYMTKLVPVAKTSDVPPGRAITVDVNDLEIMIAHVEGEGFFAIDDLCTHDGGPLGEGELYGYEVECPRHGARFDVRSGEALSLPAILPVRPYRVEVEGDVIKVAIPD
jgi:3-phenylpropionate/trans-cinnamate dioxygenase ferredoxin subunit